MNSDNQRNTKGNRYLSFSLGAENYAIPLLSVKEVIAVPEITPIPFTPPHFLGIMNLRGQVISIIDFRTKLGIKPQGSSETAVIICDLAPYCLGVVVDSINSVLSPKESEISEELEIQSTRNIDYISSVFKLDGKLILLLNIGKALSLEDIKVLSKAGKQQSSQQAA